MVDDHLLSALIAREGEIVVTRGFLTKRDDRATVLWVTPSWQLWKAEDEKWAGLGGAEVIVELSSTEAVIEGEQVAVEGVWRAGHIADARLVPLPSVVPGWVLSGQERLSIGDLGHDAYMELSDAGWESAGGNGVSIGSGVDESNERHLHFQVRLVTPEFAQWHAECPWSVDVFVSILPQKYRQLSEWPGAGPEVADWASLRTNRAAESSASP